MNKYNVWITLKKVGIISVEILLAGWLAYAYEKPEFFALVPILEGLKNYLKHRNA